MLYFFYARFLQKHVYNRVWLQMSVQFPVFLCARDCGEMGKFNSIQEIQYNLERIDVENQEYEAWDSNGVEVVLSVQEPAWLALTVRADNNRLDELRAAVIRYARAVGVSIDDSLPLDVIGATIERIRYQQERKALESNPIRRFLARFK